MRARNFCTQCFRNADINRKRFFFEAQFEQILIFVDSTRDLAPHCNVIPFVRTAGILPQIQFSVKKNVTHLSSLSKVRELGLLIEKIAI